VNKNKMNITDDIIKRLRNNELEWNDLLLKMKISDSIIEYIDAEEQNYSMIAMTPKRITREYNFTHCEIHPSTIFGILASCIPFPEHNQSPRNTYQCAMGKQAMGVYVTNYDSRLDKTAFVLNYPMRPLVDTRIMGLINLHKIPSGCPVIVAIMTQTGYNQEDSIMFNKGAIDRGLFQATIYHTEKDEDKKINGDEEIRCKPDKTKTNSIKFGNYDKLTPEGVIPENTKLDNMDIILGKVVPIKENRNDPTKVIKYTDYSRSIRTTEEMYVDQNYMDRNGDGYNFAKVRLRTMRRPVIGDKFSSRHGQKGTIGNIIPEQDMPFTKNGLKPDIIINPHAIPSRMTIAQLKETLLGKILLELGLFGDGTSFGDLDINDISKELLNLGYEQHGNEIMYNGLTGEQITTEIFIGPVFYQRLKHMVNDKTHSRSIGPKVNFTRQPAEGRSRAGGLRFGEMERDCMISHGASRFTKGRVYDASDSFSVHVCKQCGMIASYNDEQHIHMCKTCGNRIDFAYVEIPYACKLLFQELLTMNVAPRMIVQD
jgi:DNA-directed RNA polymerase II subunit RPB2